MRLFSNLREDNQTTATKITSIAVLIIATLYRSDLWNYKSAWMFARCITEVLIVLSSIPNGEIIIQFRSSLKGCNENFVNIIHNEDTTLTAASAQPA
jgi:hypothetical protein